MFNQIKDSLGTALRLSNVPQENYYMFNWEFYQDGSGGVTFYRFNRGNRDVVSFEGEKEFEEVLENLKNGQYTERINQLWHNN